MHHPPADIGSESPVPAPDMPARTTPPADTAVPPQEHPSTPLSGIGQQTRFFSWKEILLCAALFLLAGLLAACPLHYTSLWQHLATGRLLYQGQYAFGYDPFSWNTANGYWVNQNWLFDLGAFLLYHLGGGAALIGAKVVLVLVLTLLLLRAGGRQVPCWLVCLVAALALLTMSQRFYFDPFLLSLLLLAVTLALLFAEPSRNLFWPSGLLLPLFALWANGDGWFVLGPLTLLVVVAGRWLEEWGRSVATGSLQRRQLLGQTALVPLAWIVCVLNPHGGRVFLLPLELADLLLAAGAPAPADLLVRGQVLHTIAAQDAPFAGFLWLSPLSAEYWSVASRGANVAGLAFFPLLLLSLASFALAVWRPRQAAAPLAPWACLLLWGGFALLGLTRVRLLPLFALVAGFVTLLNFRQVRGPKDLHLPWVRRLAWAPSLLTFLALLALALLTVPGWLHPTSTSPAASHRVQGDLTPDPLLQETAEYLARLAPLGIGFNYNPDVAYYCAWFAPQVRSYWDGRFELFADRAVAIAQLRLAVRDIVTAANPLQVAHATQQLRRRLQEQKLTYLVLTDYARNPLVALAAQQLLFDPVHWLVLQGNGRAMVVAIPAERRRALWEAQAQSPDTLAFGPQATQIAASPPEAPPFLAERSFWQDLWEKRFIPDLDRAQYWISYFDTLSQRYLALYEVRRQAAALWHYVGHLGSVGAESTLAGPAVLARTAWHLYPGLEPRLSLPDAGPPAAPLLALRAARQALAEAPANPEAYHRFVEALERLWVQQEQHWAGASPHQAGSFRNTLRRLQWTAAAKAALRLSPQAHEAYEGQRQLQLHLKLARMYETDLYYLDVALEHYQEALALALRLEQLPGATRQQTQQRQELEQVLARLQKEVTQRRDWWLVRTLNQSVPDKVLTALAPLNQKGLDPRGLGLARQALRVLQEAPIGALSESESRFVALWQQRLLLDLGDLQPLYEVLNDLEAAQGLDALYRQTRAYVAAILGDYAGFERAVQRLEEDITYTDQIDSFLVPLLAAQALPDLRLPGEPLVRMLEFSWWQQQLRFHLQLRREYHTQVADYRFLRGLAALEQGDTAQALRLFQQARDLLLPDCSFPDRPVLERYQQLLLAQLRRDAPR